MPKIGDIAKGSVVKILKAGALVKISENETGFLHISEVSKNYVTNVNDYLKVGDEVTVRVVNLNPEEKRIYLSIRSVDNDEFEKDKEKNKNKVRTPNNTNNTSNTNNQHTGDKGKRPYKPKSSFNQNNKRKEESNDPAVIFENKMSRFMKDSQEKIRALQKNKERKQGGRKKPKNK